jgi:hypothetical protein
MKLVSSCSCYALSYAWTCITHYIKWHEMWHWVLYIWVYLAHCSKKVEKCNWRILVRRLLVTIAYIKAWPREARYASAFHNRQLCAGSSCIKNVFVMNSWWKTVPVNGSLEFSGSEHASHAHAHTQLMHSFFDGSYCSIERFTLLFTQCTSSCNRERAFASYSALFLEIAKK